MRTDPGCEEGRGPGETQGWARGAAQPSHLAVPISGRGVCGRPGQLLRLCPAAATGEVVLVFSARLQGWERANSGRVSVLRGLVFRAP